MLDAPVATPASTTTTALRVTSETQPLRQVVVHTPGHEMELVSPDNRLDLLFDDILFLGHARREHLLMCTLFERIVQADDAVLQLSTLLLEAFAEEDARHDFVERLCRSLPETNLRAVEDELKRLPPADLHGFALTGTSDLPPVRIPPLPNLMFTRDLAAVVHDRVILSHAATAARTRESIIIHVVLRHHPRFEGLRDRLVTLPPGVTFEGGDLLAASEKVVFIGHSERTSFGAIMAIAHRLFEDTPVEHVLAVDLPKRRSCMHLDTVLTFASPDEIMVYPPLLDGGFAYAVHLMPSGTPGQFLTDMRPRLRDVMAELLERDLTFLPCGGDEPLHQTREQWTDGANLFAPAPGVVVGYERNRRTFARLRDHGYRVVSAEHFLGYYETGFTPGAEKIAIQLAGTELSRGRGGPRCMTMPLLRA